MSKPELSVVIPTFAEAENIRVLCPWIGRTMREAGIGTELLVVDDDTQDGTEQWARGKHNWVGNGVQFRFISRKSERGLASAWQRGVAEASAQIIAIMDADLCHDPAHLPRMLEALANNDMVIGSRYVPGHLAVMSNKSRLAAALSRAGQHLCRSVLGLPYRDISHSFRMFRAQIGREAWQKTSCKGNAALVEHTYLVHKAGGRIAELPVSYGRRMHGKTKLRVGREGLSLLRVLLHLSKNPRISEPDYEQI